MNKKEILLFLKLIKADNGMNGDFDNFYTKHKDKFHQSYSELYSQNNDFLNREYIDDNFQPTSKLDTYIKQLESEIQKAEKAEELNDKKTKNEATLAKWQVRVFWPMFILAVLGGGYSIYDIAKPDDSVSKTELELILKDYKTKKEFEDDLINALDLIYSDSTLLNKK